MSFFQRFLATCLFFMFVSVGFCQQGDGSASDSIGKFGSFKSTNPSLELLAEESKSFGAKMYELGADFSYTDSSGKEWLVPKHSLVNGTSIPFPLWSSFGNPLSGKMRKATIIHDAFCSNDKLKLFHAADRVHKMFYEACRCEGIGEADAKLFYWAVIHFGPVWAYERRVAIIDGKQTRYRSVSDIKRGRSQLSKAMIEKVQAYIQKNKPSLDALRRLEFGSPGPPPPPPPPPAR